jgi:hypothetical protein
MRDTFEQFGGQDFEICRHSSCHVFYAASWDSRDAETVSNDKGQSEWAKQGWLVENPLVGEERI